MSLESSNPQDFIRKIEVVYSEDKPSDCLEELNGGSADINKGFGGKFVWLRAPHAERHNEMIKEFGIQIRDGEVWVLRNFPDLAKGAGGAYRYLFSNGDYRGRTGYISEVGIWRSESSLDEVPSDWNGITTNINEGRGGDFLYIVWKTKKFTGRRDRVDQSGHEIRYYEEDDTDEDEVDY